MRKRSFFLILMLTSLLIASCKGQDSYSRFPMIHVGTWTGADSTDAKGVVTFEENGTGTMEYGGSAYEFRYVFDYGKRPIWLDLLYTREGRPFRARLIVRFINENQFMWYTFFTEVRPVSFPESER